MSRRTRALAFALTAVACAAIAAAMANGYRDRVASQYGPLRPVLVATNELAAGQVLGEGELRELTAVRRVPERFVPKGAVSRPAEALGLAPGAAIPTGAYLLAAQLQPPQPATPQGPKLDQGRRPVQIAIAGAEALSVAGSPEGTLVDVVVSDEPRGAGSRGRTYVAAAGVRLLALGNGGPEGGSAATLALTRAQALTLIAAEGSARQIRLLPQG